MITYYVVMRLDFWRDTATRLPMRQEDGSAGFLPVFTSREEAEAAYPGEEVLVMREREEVAE